MTSTVQYRYLHHGDNEWLADISCCKDEGWEKAWEELKKETLHPIEFTEDIYNNQEYGEIPEWVNVTLHDEGVMAFKMGRSIVASLDGARSITFDRYFNIEVSPDFGGISVVRLEIYHGGAYVTIIGKYSNEEVEVNITDQFRKAIGEV